MTEEEREKYIDSEVLIKPKPVGGKSEMGEKKAKKRLECEGNKPVESTLITKEQYLSRRLNGEKRTPICKALNIAPNTFYSLLDDWGIRGMKEEEVLLDQMCGIDKAKEVEVKQTTPKQHDPVNHPNHYTAGGIETIDFMQAELTNEQFKGYCLGNVLKYCSRHEHKSGKEDLKKARWYLDKLLEAVGE